MDRKFGLYWQPHETVKIGMKGVAPTESLRQKDMLVPGEILSMKWGEKGGLVEVNGHVYAVRHARYRVDPEQQHDSDIDRLCISPRIEAPRHSLSRIAEAKRRLKEGQFPAWFTFGWEAEGHTYILEVEGQSGDNGQSGVGQSGNNAGVRILNISNANDSHPELTQHTIETASGLIMPEGSETTKRYPQTPLELARATATHMLEAIDRVKQHGGVIAYSSGEAGKPNDVLPADHTYLQRFAPMVTKKTYQEREGIPQETLDVYKKTGIDIIEELRNGNLLWPMNSAHNHHGTPSDSHGNVDMRIALSMVMVRQTELAEMLTYLTYNSTHFFGQLYNVQDIRSIARRLLPTTRNGTIPCNVDEYVQQLHEQLKDGQIHSASRFPATGQHDRTRLCLEATKGTVESVAAPMTPDVRSLLAYSYSQPIMTVLAMEALELAGGDESKVPQVMREWSPLLRMIPTMPQEGAKNSSYEMNLQFNRNGYRDVQGGVDRGRAKKFDHMVALVRNVGERYPALRLNADIVCHEIDRQSKRRRSILVRERGVLTPITPKLSHRLGLDENGEFNPDMHVYGTLADYKREVSSMYELIDVQARATEAQLRWIQENVTCDDDLRRFFGMSTKNGKNGDRKAPRRIS